MQMQGWQDSELPHPLERAGVASCAQGFRAESGGEAQGAGAVWADRIHGRGGKICCDWQVSCELHSRAGEQLLVLASRLVAALRHSVSPATPIEQHHITGRRQQSCTKKLRHVAIAPSDMLHAPPCCDLPACSICQTCYKTACSTGNHYTVKLNDERHTCRCVDFCCRGRQRPCKHLTLVMQQLGMTRDNPKGWHQVRHIAALTLAQFESHPCDAAAAHVDMTHRVLTRFGTVLQLLSRL